MSRKHRSAWRSTKPTTRRPSPRGTKAKRNPIQPGDLPPKAARMLEDVYESSVARWTRDGKSIKEAETIAARQAWTQVKRHYYKKGGRWHKRKDPLSQDEYPPGSRPGPRNKAANPEAKLVRRKDGVYDVMVSDRKVGRVEKMQGPRRNSSATTGQWAARTSVVHGGLPKAQVTFHGTKEDGLDAVVKASKGRRARHKIDGQARRNQPLEASLGSQIGDLETLKRRLMKR